MLGALGWHVQAARWTPDDSPAADPHGFAANAAKQAFADSPSAGQRLIVAKSFSTLCLPWAEEARIPGIWLTPLLNDALVQRTLKTSSKNDQIPGDWRASQEAQSFVFSRVEEFVLALG